MGSDAGIYGGQVRYTGTPRNSMTVKQSRTGRAVKQYDRRRNGNKIIGIDAKPDLFVLTVLRHVALKQE